MAKDIMVWVGEGFYPKAKDFINEASNLGISRKLAVMPEGIELGKSRMWFMHRDDTESGKLIGYTKIDKFEVVVNDPDSLTALEKDVQDAGGELYRTEQVAMEPLRGCGRRKPGGVYLVKRLTDAAKFKIASMKEIDKDIFLEGETVFFAPPYIIANTEYYRGYRFVDGDDMLGDLQARQYKGSVNHYIPIDEEAPMDFGALTLMVAKQAGISPTQSKKAIKSAFSIMQAEMVEGGMVTIPSFGTFRTRLKPATSGTCAGIPWQNDDTVVPRFVPSGKLKEVIAKDGKIKEGNQPGGEPEGSEAGPDTGDNDDNAAEVAGSPATDQLGDNTADSSNDTGGLASSGE